MSTQPLRLGRAFAFVPRSFAAVAATCALAVGAMWPGVAAAVKTVRIAMIHPENQHTEVLAVKAFARYIEAMSGGDLKVQFFFGTMGGAREIAEQIQQGVLDYSSLADGSLAGFTTTVWPEGMPNVAPFAEDSSGFRPQSLKKRTPVSMSLVP